MTLNFVVGNGRDYISISALQLTFDGTFEVMCVNITIVDDEIVELNETFSIQVSTTDTNVEFGIRNASIKIIDQMDSKDDESIYYLLKLSLSLKINIVGASEASPTLRGQMRGHYSYMYHMYLLPVLRVSSKEGGAGEASSPNSSTSPPN